MHLKLIFSVVFFIQIQAHSQRADTLYIDSVIVVEEGYFKCLNPLSDLYKLEDIRSERIVIYDPTQISILKNDSLLFYHSTNKGYNRDTVRLKSWHRKDMYDRFSLCQYLTYDHSMIRKRNRILFYLIDDKAKSVYHVFTIILRS